MFERELAAIARRQHGLILLDQAVRAGVPPRAVVGRAERGELVRVTRRLYRLAGVPVTFEQRALAPCLIAGRDAAASHLTAAVIHGLAGVRPGRIEITVPADRFGASPLARVHRTNRPARPRRVNGVPVTPVDRTLVEIAGRVSSDALAVAVDDALVRRLTDVARVAGVLDAADGRRRGGSAALRDVLAVWTPGPMPGSVAEMRLARMILAAGYPRLERQVEIVDASGALIGRADLGDRAVRLAIEYDGRDGHGPRTVVVDRARANAITAAGWTLLTATAYTLGRGRTAFFRALDSVYRRAA